MYANAEITTDYYGRTNIFLGTYLTPNDGRLGWYSEPTYKTQINTLPVDDKDYAKQNFINLTTRNTPEDRMTHCSMVCPILF